MEIMVATSQVIERFRKEIFWTLHLAMGNRPEELSEDSVLMLMYAGLMDFTTFEAQRNKK